MPIAPRWRAFGFEGDAARGWATRLVMGGGLSGKYAVVGVGNTAFGDCHGQDAYDLGFEALREAVADSGLSYDQLDGLVTNRIPDYARFAELLGINPRFVSQLPAQGRMSGASLMIALAALDAGLCTYVALVYGNNGKQAGATYGGDTQGGYGSGEATWMRPYGMTSPGAFHAAMFQRHMWQYGTTSADLAAVAVAFRRHASLSPSAVMRKLITVDDHQASRFIAEPLHLLDYCLINDGGVAMIITTASRARDLRQTPVAILGVGQASQLDGSSMPPEDYWYAACSRAAADVYRMSGLTQAEIDVLQIYDNFSPTVLFSLEGFGFCPRGESGRWIQGGRIELGGEFPTNTSGGHLSESYMQGWALNVEAVRQLRGACGPRQVANAKHAQYICATPVVTSIIYGSAA
jgi:acetyl-CoA acetyltransferase